MLVLWQFEQCAHSKPVRQRMTQLALDFISVSAPQGHLEKDVVMEKLFGNSTTPSLWDTRTGVLLQGEEQICEYLEEIYGAIAVTESITY